MSKFTEVVTPHTPLLAVSYQQTDNGGIFNEWAVKPPIPPILLVGAISRSIIELHASESCLSDDHTCPHTHFVLAYNPGSGQFHWFTHPSIPVDAICGMLDVIKFTIAAGLQTKVMTASNRSSILGPDGRPMVK